MDFRSVIAARRDGHSHNLDDMRILANGAAQAAIPDYQLAAWLMAAYLNPPSMDETAWLTQAMAESGERIDRTGLPKPWLDKHSTGGVGDKTSLVLLPMLAACGIPVIKMSGSGLGITGGTVDKLTSIPGFRSDLSPAEMIAQAREIGIAWSGQTPKLAPADKVLYALRDATDTVESIPLITSSILCKKLAGGAEAVLMDVKCGSGAFMKDLVRARELAHWLESIGSRCGLIIKTMVSDMDQPLGRAAGNALEVAEAIETLNGAPGPVRDLCLAFCAEAIQIAKGTSRADASKRATDVIDGGAALAKMRQWVEAQGGDPRVIDDPALLPRSEQVSNIQATRAGWVRHVDAGIVGLMVLKLGGGRLTKGAVIDLAAGVESLVRVGDRVSKDQPVVRLHGASEGVLAEAAELAQGAIQISEDPVPARPLML